MALEDIFSDFGGFAESSGEDSLANLFQSGDFGAKLSFDPGQFNAPETGFFDKLGAGLSEFGGKLGTQIMENPLGSLQKGLGLGAGALGAWNAWKQSQNSGKQQGVVERSQRQMEGMGAAGAGAATTLIPAGSAAMLGGPLPPGLQAEADMWKADAQQRVRSYAAKAGISDSTMMATMENQIDMQYNILKQKLSESLLTAGTAAEAGAMGPLSGAANTAQAQLNSADAAIAAAYKSLAMLMDQTGSEDNA